MMKHPNEADPRFVIPADYAGMIEDRPAADRVKRVRSAPGPSAIPCQCGGLMLPEADGAGAASIVGGIILLLIGLPAMLAFPCGTVIGALIVVLAIVLLSRSRKVWRCQACRAVLQRS